MSALLTEDLLALNDHFLDVPLLLPLDLVSYRVLEARMLKIYHI